MIEISEGQMRGFESSTREVFEQRAVRHLRALFPEETSLFSDDTLRERVRSGEARAGSYGLVTERQVMCFVDTGFMLTPQFDSDAEYWWTYDILTEPDVTTDQRAWTLLNTAEREWRCGKITAGSSARG